MKALSDAGKPRHPRLVAEDRAAGARRGGIDREHRDLVAALDQEHAERVDGGGFADPGRAGDADADRLAGVGQQRLHQLARRCLMVARRLSISVIARASAARLPARRSLARVLMSGGELFGRGMPWFTTAASVQARRATTRRSRLHFAEAYSYSAASLCPSLALSLWISSSAASAITVPGGKIASAPAL